MTDTDLWWWSYLLTLVGVVGLWQAGSRKWWGWCITLGGQVLWLAYALVSGQHGFVLGAFAYGAVYARNWYRWYKESGR